ncbi:MAG: PIN domain-containing protein [Opitutaceae bacterium]|jgi:predicted nucleic acid-binding protein|nr:PIN domain-containing protein [Opitutaceae bacterium]
MSLKNETVLLDGNVFVALLLDTAKEHARVTQWADENPDVFLATCSVTEGTFLRLYLRHEKNKTLSNAWEALRRFRVWPRHVFFDAGFSYIEVPCVGLTGGGQITDAWLATLARRKGCRVATFDSGFLSAHPDVAFRS